ncbi:interleukin-13 receptor subunit alpha-2-like isoform X1 [Melanerpes formicivorus]|uniref:interleukin-13 receptor subunit alpha-2-like isoform X1 n=1 Tax=Melanerpes formicivorus TaxID=211600 RepID=UPI00358E5470
MAVQRLSVLWVMLLWGCAVSFSSHTTVAPPRDLQITDPGLLGCLDIEWKPPASLQSFNDCTVTYKFEHHNAGDRDWKVIFTRKLKLRVGFDLSRTVEVRVQTLVRGRCTGDVEVHSGWAHATFQLPLQGKQESEVQNFHCIYHNWEYLKCTWQPGLLAPRGAHYGLYYWYEGLDQAAQCEDYIQEHGINTGCRLQNLSQAEYKDLSICVNGSGAAALLRPLYVTLRLQDLAKPSPPTQLVVFMSAAEELQVAWSPPGGETPPQCLEYEVQLARDPREAKAAWMEESLRELRALELGEEEPESLCQPRWRQLCQFPEQTRASLLVFVSGGGQTSCVLTRASGVTGQRSASLVGSPEQPASLESLLGTKCWSSPAEYRKGDQQLLILIPVILSLSSSLIIFMLLGQCRKRSPAGKLPFDASMGS